MIRSTLGMLANSQFPQSIGVCANDLPLIAATANRCQQMLIDAGGETGWLGGWMKVVFAVDRCNPYVTLPREFSRIINLDACRFPMQLQNEFYEFLEAGVGLQSYGKCQNWCGAIGGYGRGFFPVLRELDPVGQQLRVYLTDARDIGRRVLVGPAWDQNGTPIYSQDGNNSVNGFYMTLEQPFTTSTFQVSRFTGIQKDASFGDVLLYQVDATTGLQVLLSRYAPDELIPSYQRYYFNGLPCSCAPVCPQSACLVPVNAVPPTVGVTAICKLEFIPANRATDFLIIGNIPALIEEGKSVRFADMDSANAPLFEAKSHKKAIQLLQNELGGVIGKLNLAVNFAPWGTSRLSRPLQAVRFG